MLSFVSYFPRLEVVVSHCYEMSCIKPAGRSIPRTRYPCDPASHESMSQIRPLAMSPNVQHVPVLTRPKLCDQWKSASTLPYLTPSTFSSKPNPALSTIISSVKSRLSNSTPLVVVRRVKRLRGTALRSVVSVHTWTRSRAYAAGGSSASHAMRSSVTRRDWPGRKFRV